MQNRLMAPPLVASSQDVLIQGDFDKLLGLGRNGHVLTPFTAKNHAVKLSAGFIKPKL